MPPEMPSINIGTEPTVLEDSVESSRQKIESAKTVLLDAQLTVESGVRKREKIRELVESAKPQQLEVQFFGKGAEHLVLEYRNPEDHGKVIKVNFHKTLMAGAGNLKSAEGRRRLAEELEQERAEHLAQRRLLRSYFGFHALPAEKSFVDAVPLTDPELSQELAPEYFFDQKKTPPVVPALVTIQRRAESLEKDEKGNLIHPDRVVDLTEFYVEVEKSSRRGQEKGLSDEEYIRGHRLLIGQPYESRSPLNTEEQDRKDQIQECITMYPSLAHVIEMQQKDPFFRDQVRNFARQVIQYANGEPKKKRDNTKESEAYHPILDFVGEHNIVLTKGADEKWKTALLDPLHPNTEDLVAYLKNIAPMIEENPRSFQAVRNLAMNVLHYFRYANALAIITGIPERVQVPKEIRRVPASTWRQHLMPGWRQEEKKKEMNEEVTSIQTPKKKRAG